jgi:Lar family restriction alleviation protein
MSPFDADHFTDINGNALEDTGGPRLCPFCGGGADQLVIERWSDEDDPDASYHVECLKCGCNGPQAETQLEAAQGWNGRSG